MLLKIIFERAILMNMNKRNAKNQSLNSKGNQN